MTFDGASGVESFINAQRALASQSLPDAAVLTGR